MTGDCCYLPQASGQRRQRRSGRSSGSITRKDLAAPAGTGWETARRGVATVNRAELVSLVDVAPGDLRTLSATLRTWTHTGRSQEAIRLVNEGVGKAIGITTELVGGQGAGDEVEVRSTAWYEAPGRWSVLGDAPTPGAAAAAAVDVCDGDRHWRGDTRQVTAHPAPSPPSAGPLAWMLAPGHLLGSYTFATPADDEVGGRACVRVTARPRPLPGASGGFAGALGTPGAGLDNTYWFDAEMGIVLRHVGAVDGRPSTVTELLGVRVDEPVGPDRFRPPAGAAVRSEWDERLALLDAAGIDATGIAEGDAGAIRSLLVAGTAPPAPADVVAGHVPTGPPPADPVAAEAAIVAAFAAVSDPDPDDPTGQRLAHVQAGDGLMPYVERAAARVPGGRGAGRWVVDALRFLDADHAVVVFAVEVGGRRYLTGRVGRAVRADARWLVEHATFVDVLAMAGERVPPPEAR